MSSEKQGFDAPPPYTDAYPPQPGYDQHQGQGHPLQGYATAPPQQEYPPQAGYAPQPGYAPQGLYDPKANPPPQQGYPPAQEYPHNQPGYPPAQPGYVGNRLTVVTQQPYMTTGVVAGPNPPDYLVASILACLCCFWPTGLCAIYFACRRDTLMAEGNNLDANRMATNARNLTILSFVLGIIWILVVIVTNRY